MWGLARLTPGRSSGETWSSYFRENIYPFATLVHVVLPFRRRIRHPFYPALKPAAAAAAPPICPALYGAFEELSAACEMGVRVSRAVFPLRRPGNPFLPDKQRDALWQMFQVPIHALLVDARGEVVG